MTTDLPWYELCGSDEALLIRVAEETFRRKDERIRELEGEVVSIKENLSAAESEEVCGASHPDPFRACPWCQRDELLEALREGIQAADSIDSQTTDDWLSSARAAIARATGEAP